MISMDFADQDLLLASQSDDISLGITETDWDILSEALDNSSDDNDWNMALATPDIHRQPPSSRCSQKRSTSRKPRKSCDFCAQRKKRCDGNGTNPCSLCIKKKRPMCLYGLRAPHKSKMLAHRVCRGKAKENTARDTQDPTNMLETVAVRRGVTSLKRCRLSASPATGLVGMQENMLLNDYFACMSAMPVTSESHIRRAMVSVMFASARRRRREVPDDEIGSNDQELELIGAQRPAVSLGRMRHREEAGEVGLAAVHGFASTDPAVCMMWCAIALGALLRGQPMEHVNRYVELAHDALTGCFDDDSIEAARAYLSMAVLHNYLGNKVKNQRYVTCARIIMEALPDGDVPPVLVEIMKTEDEVRISCGQNATQEELKLLREDTACKAEDIQRHMGELQKLVTQEEMSRFVLWADRRVGRAIFEGVISKEAVLHRPEDGEIAELSGVDDHDVGRAPAKFSPSEARRSISLVVSDEEDQDISGIAESCRGVLEELSPQFEHLRLVGRGSAVCTGVGGLILNGNIAMIKCMTRDMAGGMDYIKRCLDIVLRFPGLCRYPTWTHMAHVFAVCFVASESRGLYDKLRGAFNSVRLEKCPPLPPFEECQGVAAICSRMFCRALSSAMLERFSSVNLEAELEECGESDGIFWGADQDGDVSALGRDQLEEIMSVFAGCFEARREGINWGNYHDVDDRGGHECFLDVDVDALLQEPILEKDLALLRDTVGYFDTMREEEISAVS